MEKAVTAAAAAVALPTFINTRTLYIHIYLARTVFGCYTSKLSVNIFFGFIR